MGLAWPLPASVVQKIALAIVADQAHNNTFSLEATPARTTARPPVGCRYLCRIAFRRRRSSARITSDAQPFWGAVNSVGSLFHADAHREGEARFSHIKSG